MSAEPLQTRNERNAGLLLIAAAAAALALANGPWASGYHQLLEVRIGPVMPRLGVMSVHQWISDAATALRWRRCAAAPAVGSHCGTPARSISRLLPSPDIRTRQHPDGLARS
jgi:hypothetical protein